MRGYMEINLGILNYSFVNKPLLIGGKAMEYYGLRKAGSDIDLVIHNDDHKILKEMYPNNIRDLYGDILKALAMEMPKNHKDLEMIVKLILNKAYKKL